MKNEDKLQVCWQAFSMENSLLQSYRALFMMLEVALLASGFVILQFYKGPWILAPAIIGWIVAIIWIIICEGKGRDVDRWMKKIVALKSVIGNGSFDYLEPGVKLSGGRTARGLFNYAIPVVIAVLLVIMVILSK